jgi:pyruvate-formate lyase-activating enzyme
VICTAPWTTLEVVDPDGRARQCCADWTAGDRGNLHERALLEVWNGPGYRMARRVMGSGTLGPLCHAICPRLYDGKFAERELSIIPGAEPFVANQELLLEDIAARREVTRALPLYIAVCPSTYCNYDCIMCLHGRSPRRDLPESIWDELLAMLPTLRVLTLLGGEPLANPLAMQFLRAWDSEKYPDAAVSLVTNGSLLGANVLAHLERCRFGNVTVSLNAGTPDVYARVQRGIALDEVLANVDALVGLRRRQRTSFPIVLSFVVQPANHATLVQFGEIARARGLPIRLMPLGPRGPEGLDFYGDADEVARVLASLDAMAAWAAHAAPDYGQEIHGTRAAIAAEAAERRRPGAPAAIASGSA